MNKFQFTKLLAHNNGITQNAAIELVDMFTDSLAQGLVLDGIVKINDYLVFEVKEPSHFKSGLVRNPKTGEMTELKMRKRLSCRAGKKLREIIQGYDKNAQHDLSFLAAKKRSNKDSDGNDYE